VTCDYFVSIDDDDLFLDHPLAEGFDILDGGVVIKVPKVKPGNEYSVVREYTKIVC